MSDLDGRTIWYRTALDDPGTEFRFIRMGDALGVGITQDNRINGVEFDVAEVIEMRDFLDDWLAKKSDTLRVTVKEVNS
jgi:hypothetical protein